MSLKIVYFIIQIFSEPYKFASRINSPFLAFLNSNNITKQFLYELHSHEMKRI